MNVASTTRCSRLLISDILVRQLLLYRYSGGRMFFFFQAEDGIRDLTVTGVQTCALPIFHDTINGLARAGAEVLHQEIAPVHVSGHANQEEIRTVLSLVRPKAVMPMHGEYRMLAAHARMAGEAGVPANAIVPAENGSGLGVGAPDPDRPRLDSSLH